MTLRSLAALTLTAARIGLALWLLLVATGGCAEVTNPIAPCEYAAKPLSDSTAVITYASLPCWDANNQRVVRKR